MVKTFKAEAKSAGATEIIIKGVDIIEKRLIQNVDFMTRLGYKVEKTAENSIKISKKI